MKKIVPCAILATAIAIVGCSGQANNQASKPSQQSLEKQKALFDEDFKKAKKSMAELAEWTAAQKKIHAEKQRQYAVDKQSRLDKQLQLEAQQQQKAHEALMKKNATVKPALEELPPQ